jgi:hypothetical protein
VGPWRNGSAPASQTGDESSTLSGSTIRATERPGRSRVAQSVARGPHKPQVAGSSPVPASTFESRAPGAGSSPKAASQGSTPWRGALLRALGALEAVTLLPLACQVRSLDAARGGLPERQWGWLLTSGPGHTGAGSIPALSAWKVRHVVCQALPKSVAGNSVDGFESLTFRLPLWPNWQRRRVQVAEVGGSNPPSGTQSALAQRQEARPRGGRQCGFESRGRYGRIAQLEERLSYKQSVGGSSPSATTDLGVSRVAPATAPGQAGTGSGVARHPPGPRPVAQPVEQLTFNQRVAGSRPAGPTRSPEAQLAEQRTVNAWDAGSSPAGRALRPWRWERALLGLGGSVRIRPAAPHSSRACAVEGPRAGCSTSGASSRECSARRDPLPQRPREEVTAVISVLVAIAVTIAVTLF